MFKKIKRFIKMKCEQAFMRSFIYDRIVECEKEVDRLENTVNRCDLNLDDIYLKLETIIRRIESLEAWAKQINEIDHYDLH